MSSGEKKDYKKKGQTKKDVNIFLNKIKKIKDDPYKDLT